MTLENCFEYRNWALSLLEDTINFLKIKHNNTFIEQFYYLKTWIEKFDKLVSNFTCWNENHNVYKSGFEDLKKLCMSL